MRQRLGIRARFSLHETAQYSCDVVSLSRTAERDSFGGQFLSVRVRRSRSSDQPGARFDAACRQRDVQLGGTTYLLAGIVDGRADTQLRSGARMADQLAGWRLGG